ncbi:hypothetical protein FACS1894110_26350 [Spirochaetia bacterium]|nr:hypothetical protein FACS1894110_26350 [Spirochaetia bacterium]
MANTNRNYKDSVFSLLFNDPQALRELYSALEEVPLPPDAKITVNTLSDALFMGQLNDLSFMVDKRLIILVEHQSTINPNMALRLLLYIARVYEKEIADRKIYTVKKIALPRPEFFVLYNGTADYPDEAVIRLSDSFVDTSALGLPQSDAPTLELAARVININQGRNEAKVRRCKLLSEYSAFIAKVRELMQQGADREEAMKQAIKYCREHDILKEFLEKHSTEVFNMVLTGWDFDVAKQVWYEDGREQGIEQVALNALSKGMSMELVQQITGLPLEAITELSRGI